MIRMPYPEVQKVNDGIDAIKDHLRAFGYKYCGGGSFAEVFVKDDHVVKVGLVNGDNYLNYVRMVGLRSENPHLPYILSVAVFDVNPDTAASAPFYVVKMEKLRENERHRHTYWKKLGMEHPGMLMGVEPKTTAMQEVKKILLHLSENFGAMYDIGSKAGSPTANVMWRGQTAVFTDPVV